MRYTADAEVAKRTGGMVALIPCDGDARNYAVPGGEPIEDLHLTLAYFGEDVGGADPVGILGALDSISGEFPVIDARVFAWALFNPDGHDDRDPCATYLVGDNPYISDLRDAVQDIAQAHYEMPDQHEPFVPHVTAGYGLPIDSLRSPGPIRFDRLSLHWVGQVYDFPLVGGPHE